MGIKAFLENGFGAKTKVVSIWKQGFSVFCKFLSDEVETILGKDTQSVQNYLNQNMGIRTFLENGFRATLSSNSIVGGVWKKFLQLFVSFWVTKFKLFSGKLRQRVQDYLNQCLVIWSFLQNAFGATLSSKTNVLIARKKALFSFLQIFWWQSWDRFLEKWGKELKSIQIKVWA